MTIILNVLVIIHLDMVAVATQIITCQIYQHHMLGILLGVVSQKLSTFTVSLCIARALGGAGNRIDVGLISLYTTMCLRRRTEDSEASEVKIEKIG